MGEGIGVLIMFIILMVVMAYFKGGVERLFNGKRKGDDIESLNESFGIIAKKIKNKFPTISNLKAKQIDEITNDKIANKLDKLDKLQQLKNQNILTDAEFNFLKEKY